MKKIASFLLILATVTTYSQNKLGYKFGKITPEERSLNNYKLDTTANALVLYESGNTSFIIKKNIIIIQTKFYTKIKIFNKEGYRHGTFEIPLYNNKSRSESVQNIRAFTHNLSTKIGLKKSSIYNKRINENWSQVSFTLPNLKEGSIIEVEYTLESPFKFNLTGWEFQSDIPKKFSQYKASIPGNYVYNRKLNGYLKLIINSSVIKKNCFSVPGFSGYANCEMVTYAMNNIPAFIDEGYMTSSDNFISKIKFELSELLWFDGQKQKYTTTWKSVDREFKGDKNIGGQVRKTKFFKGKLPQEIHQLDSDLKKAKEVYNFIQNHYTWNKKYSIFKNVKVKKAFGNKIGNTGEINISLVNSLKAVGLDAELMLISTRDNGLPTKLHPVISDFNYVIVKLKINSKSYLLDATNKLVPFGILPFKCLNSYGRVMDFKNESYWYDIDPITNSKTQHFVSLKLHENGIIKGKIRKVSFGYNALFRREEILNETKDVIISNIEKDFDNLEIISYETTNKIAIDKPLIETFEVELEIDAVSNFYHFSPFFASQYKINPFKQEKRMYPVNFGFPFKNIINFSLEIPSNYTIESLPKSKSYALSNKGGSFNLEIKKHKSSRITINSTIQIDKPIYYNFEYESLMVLFNHIINNQKTPIALKKIDANN